MSQPERVEVVVVDMVEYLRETIAQMDAAINPYLASRQELALRLAALEAASDPAILAAAEDYADRVEADRPYEEAEDAEELLSEAHRRYC
jgi:chorismate mutase